MLALDFETVCFRPGLMAPPPVCLSWAAGDQSGLVPTPQAREAFIGSLEQRQVWHNAPYDLACAVAWWDCAEQVVAALEADRIGDTWAIERIAEISGLTPRKDLSLANLYQAHGLGVLPKDEVRTSYGPLLDRPLAEYSPEQVAYATDDAVATLRLYQRQATRWLDRGAVHWEDVCHLTRKRFWLQLCSVYGLRTDGTKIDALKAAVARRIGELREAAQQPILLRGENDFEGDLDKYRLVRMNGTKNMLRLQALVAEAYLERTICRPGVPLKAALAAVVQEQHALKERAAVPLTTETRRPKDAPPRKKPWVPSVKTARGILEESGDERLVAFAEYGSWASTEKVVPHYAAGATVPIHTKYGIADSTRTTSSKPQVQNLGKKTGIRECFVPRPGYVFISVDHGGLENATLAQWCIWYLGRRGLADWLNQPGADLHCKVAGEIFGCTYEQALEHHKQKHEAFELARDSAKTVVFARPGAAGWRRVKISAKQLQGLDWTEAQAKAYCAAWDRAVPEGKAMHEWVARQQAPDGTYSVPIPGTKIIRRKCTFCSACNNSFQALGTVVEAAVGWEMTRERLLGRTRAGEPSPLRWAPMVVHVHDEFIFECPLALIDPVARRLETLMHEVPLTIMPDVPLRSEAVAMRYWSKKAKRLTDAQGRLIPWPE